MWIMIKAEPEDYLIYLCKAQEYPESEMEAIHMRSIRQAAGET